MAAREDPSKTRKYSDAFKLTAVRMTQLSGMQVKTEAAGLDLHPFLLWHWRKEVRDGVNRGRLPHRAPTGPLRELAQPQALKRAHALLQEGHDLQRRGPFGSVPYEGRSV
ncbi:MAG TPA: transposase [Gemmatimonadaceae bacterium]|jgi:transposase|nr:transposase [Gemmatimonadaceae bacterium]HNV77600.1 transposase [Gemmatimonadaceae bacterium]